MPSGHVSWFAQLRAQPLPPPCRISEQTTGAVPVAGGAKQSHTSSQPLMKHTFASGLEAELRQPMKPVAPPMPIHLHRVLSTLPPMSTQAFHSPGITGSHAPPVPPEPLAIPVLPAVPVSEPALPLPLPLPLLAAVPPLPLPVLLVLLPAVPVAVAVADADADADAERLPKVVVESPPEAQAPVARASGRANTAQVRIFMPATMPRPPGAWQASGLQAQRGVARIVAAAEAPKPAQ